MPGAFMHEICPFYSFKNHLREKAVTVFSSSGVPTNVFYVKGSILLNMW